MLMLVGAPVRDDICVLRHGLPVAVQPGRRVRAGVPRYNVLLHNRHLEEHVILDHEQDHVFILQCRFDILDGEQDDDHEQQHPRRDGGSSGHDHVNVIDKHDHDGDKHDRGRVLL